MELATQAIKKRGKLSYDDHESLLLAIKNNWIFITNDNRLRAECKIESVELLWGLEPMKILVKNGKLTLAKAIRVAKKIQNSNPDYITDSILQRFDEQLLKDGLNNY